MSKYEIILAAIETAKQELRQAEQNLNYAEPELIEAAVFEISAKRRKVNGLIKMARNELAMG